jgi:membrane-associated protease RseP (regulator of RpoE activity)
MSYLIGVLVFVIALLVSIMLHEAGHLATAKAFGMKATQFFVGFGPTLWSRQRGETEYGVRAFPVGGFVKITGTTSMDEVDPADEPRTLRAHPAWQRSIVWVAGSFMHFAFAFALLVFLAGAVGVASQSGTTITVLPCVPSAAGAGCAAGNHSRSPAVIAGLRSGDKIVAIGGRPVRDWSQVGKAISSHQAGSTITVIVARGQRDITTTATLARASWHTGGFLGVEPVTTYNRAAPFTAVADAGSLFGAISTQSVTALGHIPAAIPYLFAPNRAHTPGGQVGSMIGAANVTGQVVAAQLGWQVKVSAVLLIVVEVNIFVGIFNLLPLLPLDGGHLAIVLFERARSGLARLARRPDPGRVDITKVIPVSVGLFALIVAFALVLIAADIVNPLSLGGLR